MCYDVLPLSFAEKKTGTRLLNTFGLLKCSWREVGISGGLITRPNPVRLRSVAIGC